MAATLAGVCQVPLTAVLLLIELTWDYRIVLPLLGAFVVSSLIASGQKREMNVGDKKTSFRLKDNHIEELKSSVTYSSVPSDSSSLVEETSNSTDLRELKSSLCVDDSFIELKILGGRVSVSQAM